MFVNADVGKEGYVKAAVVSRQKEPVSKYHLAECVPVTADSLKSPVAWKNAQQIELPSNDQIRLTFELKNAKLYSFWME